MAKRWVNIRYKIALKELSVTAINFVLIAKSYLILLEIFRDVSDFPSFDLWKESPKWKQFIFLNYHNYGAWFTHGYIKGSTTCRSFSHYSLLCTCLFNVLSINHNNWRREDKDSENGECNHETPNQNSFSYHIYISLFIFSSPIRAKEELRCLPVGKH